MFEQDQSQELRKFLPRMTGPFRVAAGGESKVSALVIVSAAGITKLQKTLIGLVLTGPSILGGIGCACCLLWFPLVYDDPQNHPFISPGEKRYIVSSLAQEVH